MDVNSALNEILQTLVAGVISLAGILTTIYVNKAIELAKLKAQAIKDEQAKKILTNALNNVDELICTNIVAVENTLKPQILEAIKDGKIDKSELNNLSLVVKENVINQMGQQTNTIINEALSDVNSYLESRIEKILADLKNSDSNAVNYTTI